MLFNPKRAGGWNLPPLDIFCYISAGCYFFALKLHDFFSSSLALDLRPFKKKIGPGVMTRHCVIEHWVQRKTDFQWKLHTNRVFCIFLWLQDTLSLCFILFIWFIWSKNMCKHTLRHMFIWSKNMCKHTLRHILPKHATFAWKIAKNHDFGDFWWFSCFWHDVTVASYKVCLYFFWYQWTREGHSYPLVPHTWCFVNRFPRSWGVESAPPAVRWVQKARLF